VRRFIMEVSPSDRVQGLIALLEDASAESRRYRDYEWQISVLAVTLLGTIYGLRVGYDLSLPWWTPLLVGAVALGHLLFAHWRLTATRIRRHQYEHTLRILLQLDTPDWEVWKTAPVPTKWERWKIFGRGWAHLLSWTLLIVGAAILPWITFPGKRDTEFQTLQRAQAGLQRDVDRLSADMRSRLDGVEKRLSDLQSKEKASPAKKRP
jgi:hypothetical protein